MAIESDQELEQGQEQQVEGDAPETVEGGDTQTTEQQTTQEQTPAPQTRKGPPEVLPYERFQQENRARRAAEARAAALEAELAATRKGTQPTTKRTEEHEFIAEAVKPLIEQVRGETGEALSYIEQMKDEREAEKFWSDPKVNTELRDRVEELYAAAREEARSRGQRLAFSRRDIYVYERGLMAEASEAEARAKTSEMRAAAEAQQGQSAKVNRIAKVESGGTGKAPAKTLDQMTPKERAKFIEEKFGNNTF